MENFAVNIIAFAVVVGFFIYGYRQAYAAAKETLTTALLREIERSHPVFASRYIFGFFLIDGTETLDTPKAVAENIISKLSMVQVNKLTCLISPFSSAVEIMVDSANNECLTMTISVDEVNKVFTVDPYFAHALVGKKTIKNVTGREFSNEQAPIGFSGLFTTSDIRVYILGEREAIKVKHLPIPA